jgi:phenylalanyl-tRNA synthetase beta chain
MKIPINWLSDYVDTNLDPQDIAHRLTMAGLEIVGVDHQDSSWDGIYVGHVDAVIKHPNADRLKICTVNLGVEILEIVCGAPNVEAGKKIALARVGTSLLNSTTGEYETLKQAKIRGVESNGMICSEQELGIGDDHSGILILSDRAQVGTPISEYFGGISLELEATPNRPDAMSLLGVARELAALTKTPLKAPSLEYSAVNFAEENLKVRVDEPGFCPRYLCVTVRGVEVRESPDWLQQRLRSVGQRPINNVVDITNYVMFELGQPLHAFDRLKIQNETIIVRKSYHGEMIEALDGNQYSLSSDDLVIADFSKPIAIAGIIGGSGTQVDDNSIDLVLEAASFLPAIIRKTSRRLGIRTDASNRFEKGLRTRLPELALRRACMLLEQIAGGTISSEIMDLNDTDSVKSVVVRITSTRIRSILGVEIDLGTVQSVLDSLGFDLHKKRPEYLDVVVPPWRSDIAIEEDLIEEVARIIGYDSIPAIALSSALPQAQTSGIKDLRDVSVDVLVAAGMQQIISYPLISESILRSLPKDLSNKAVKVLNPMTTDHEFLRASLRPSILQVASYNYRRQIRTLRLFESGRIFLGREHNLPEEKEILVGLFGGERWDGTWIGEKGKLGFFDAKGVVESLFTTLGLRVKFSPEENYWMEVGRTAVIKAVGEEDIVLGVVGEIDRDVLDSYGMDLEVIAMFEIDLDGVYQSMLMHGDTTLFDSFSRTPGVYRDLSLIAAKDQSSDAIRSILEDHPLVVDATLFDLYEDEGGDGSQRVLGYRLLFQSINNTLTAEEVTGAEHEILQILNSQLGITLRS